MITCVASQEHPAKIGSLVDCSSFWGWIPKDWVGPLFGANWSDKRHDKIGPAPDFLTKQNVDSGLLAKKAK